MKKLLYLLLACTLALTACTQEVPEEQIDDISSYSEPPYEGNEYFDTFGEMLDFLSAGEPWGENVDLMLAIRDRGYIYQLALDGELIDYDLNRQEGYPNTSINVAFEYGEHLKMQIMDFEDSYLGFLMAIPAAEAIAKAKEGEGIKYLYENYFIAHQTLSAKGFEPYEWKMGEQNIECLIQTGDSNLKFVHFMYDDIAFRICTASETIAVEDILSRLTLVKVELPDKDEAKARLDELEKQREEEREKNRTTSERYEVLREVLNSQKGRVK